MMLSAPSQVLERNQELFTQGRWLLANPADAGIFQALDNADLDGFHQYFDQYQACQKHAKGQHVFAAAFSAQEPYDGAVMYLPKAKAHARMMLANLASCVRDGGQLLVVGENKAGIKSAAKLLEAHGTQVNKVDSARHCSLFATVVEGPRKAFSLSQWQQQLTFEINDISVPVVSLPGVFSHGELDAGTRLLLDNPGPMPSGRVLDFACGAGVIGCYLARQNTQIDLVMSDVNALALYCAEQSAQLNQIEATVIASDGMAQISGQFSAIFTNPPFHTGVNTDYTVTETFIRSASKHLKKGGRILMVANRFLKYPDLLERHYARFETVARTSKFNLYQVFS